MTIFFGPVRILPVAPPRVTALRAVSVSGVSKRHRPSGARGISDTLREHMRTSIGRIRRLWSRRPRAIRRSPRRALPREICAPCRRKSIGQLPARCLQSAYAQKRWNIRFQRKRSHHAPIQSPRGDYRHSGISLGRDMWRLLESHVVRKSGCGARANHARSAIVPASSATTLSLCELRFQSPTSTDGADGFPHIRLLAVSPLLRSPPASPIAPFGKRASIPSGREHYHADIADYAGKFCGLGHLMSAPPPSPRGDRP